MAKNGEKGGASSSKMQTGASEASAESAVSSRHQAPPRAVDVKDWQQHLKQMREAVSEEKRSKEEHEAVTRFPAVRSASGAGGPGDKLVVKKVGRVVPGRPRRHDLEVRLLGARAHVVRSKTGQGFLDTGFGAAGVGVLLACRALLAGVLVWDCLHVRGWEHGSTRVNVCKNVVGCGFLARGPWLASENRRTCKQRSGMHAKDMCVSPFQSRRSQGLTRGLQSR
eukprot:2041189-Rhodomonas_salina.2